MKTKSGVAAYIGCCLSITANVIFAECGGNTA
jgi:hypothetical protein